MKTIEEVIAKRNEICAKKGIGIMKVFDTNEHEPDKDVILGELNKKQIVLRVGERRPLNFFPKGYCGKHLVIPRSILINTRVPYEVEEYLPGKMFCEIMPQPKYNRLICSAKWLEKLVQAHWEFQGIAKKINLPGKIKKPDFILKYFKHAEKLILQNRIKEVKNIINGKAYSFFWHKAFPCKWKFAPDNLLAMPKGKVGYIDLAGVSRRHWGYDLGWLIWPQWFHFKTNDYKHFKEHYGYIEKYFSLIYKHAPVYEKRDKKLFMRKCNLVLFERIIGALYDISAKISHTSKMSTRQKKEMTGFLNELLNININKIQYEQ